MKVEKLIEILEFLPGDYEVKVQSSNTVFPISGKVEIDVDQKVVTFKSD